MPDFHTKHEHYEKNHENGNNNRFHNYNHVFQILQHL